MPEPTTPEMRRMLRARKAQGLPYRIEDRKVVDRIAAMLIPLLDFPPEPGDA